MKSILVVDDEQDILLALNMLLTEEGYSVMTASNGKQALERLAEKRPDLMFLDIMMPVLNGPDTIRRIRADPEYAKIPIILMSAVTPRFSREDYPWDEFLRKPFDIDTVLNLIQRFCK